MTGEVVRLDKFRSIHPPKSNRTEPVSEEARRAAMPGRVEINREITHEHLEMQLAEVKLLLDTLQKLNMSVDNFQARYEAEHAVVDEFYKVCGSPRWDKSASRLAYLTAEEDHHMKLVFKNLQQIAKDLHEAIGCTLERRRLQRLIEAATDGIEPQKLRVLAGVESTDSIEKAIAYAADPGAHGDRCANAIATAGFAIAQGQFARLPALFSSVEKAATVFEELKQQLKLGNLVRVDLFDKA